MIWPTKTSGWLSGLSAELMGQPSVSSTRNRRAHRKRQKPSPKHVAGHENRWTAYATQAGAQLSRLYRGVGLGDMGWPHRPPARPRLGGRGFGGLVGGLRQTALGARRRLRM